MERSGGWNMNSKDMHQSVMRHIFSEIIAELAAVARKSLELGSDKGIDWSKEWKVNFLKRLRPPRGLK